MVREQIRINIPKEYLDNAAKGLCKVCGKEKHLFDKGMKKYCSDECKWKYNDCFLKYSSLRDFQLFKEDKCKCGQEATEVDHIIAIVNGGEEFDPLNLQSLCHDCHVKKTRLDMMEYRLKKKQQSILGEHYD